jgi:hypothetical protein
MAVKTIHNYRLFALLSERVRIPVELLIKSPYPSVYLHACNNSRKPILIILENGTDKISYRRFWRWYITLGINNTTFRKTDVFPFSVEEVLGGGVGSWGRLLCFVRYKDLTSITGQLSLQWLRLVLSREPREYSSPTSLPEEGKRSTFINVVFFRLRDKS